MKASRIMTINVTCITPETPLPRAQALMKQLRVRHLPVVTQGVLCGILSDRDLLSRGSLLEGTFVLPDISTSQAMTLRPITCRAGTPVSQLAALMLEHRIDSLPIVNAFNELVGLVTSTDLMSLLLEPEQLSNEPPFRFQMCTADERMAPSA
ncbi:CBS domain-containing protein [Hyalangium rubrum]|uniref:CBS domain-containing protein n=1 Tax=Hyalangium rubrum TaxID=3103134 RepID=A0ABU5HA81_9BACT|nr:CBS domain-containing protein [Hyalangium sp. s54d21]MDY7230375.1 CBS domain-containing protein [Hyalangium sp. s54d21]